MQINFKTYVTLRIYRLSRKKKKKHKQGRKWNNYQRATF